MGIALAAEQERQRVELQRKQEEERLELERAADVEKKEKWNKGSETSKTNAGGLWKKSVAKWKQGLKQKKLK